MYLSTIKKILNCDDSFKTKIIPRRHFSGTILDWGNNGVGSRFARGKLDYIVVYHNKNYKVYSFKNNNITLEASEIHNFFKHNLIPNQGIVGIKIIGLRPKLDNRTIPQSVRNHYRNKCCVVCGTSTNLIIDHKDGFYKNKQSSIKDFQVLCNHCNLVKRQRYKENCKHTNSLSVRTIPHLEIFQELFPEDSPNHSFWHDPCAYTQRIYDEIQNLREHIKRLES